MSIICSVMLLLWLSHKYIRSLKKHVTDLRTSSLPLQSDWQLVK